MARPKLDKMRQLGNDPQRHPTDGQRKGTMQLFKIAARKNQTDTQLGRFYMSFKGNVTKRM